MKLINLKTSHRDNSIGLDKIPYFSWMIESDEPDTYQSSYRIWVLNKQKEIVWDSTEIPSDQNDYIKYEGAELQSCEKYIWKVEVTDNHGNSDDASGTFETAFLGPAFEGTGAKWISEANPVIKRDVGFGNQPRATYFRREFNLDEKPQNATIYVTSHGAYEFTLNKENVADRKLATEYSSFEKVLFYQNYNITDKINAGANVLDITVGDGWYCSIKNMMKVELEDKYHALIYAIKFSFADDRCQWVYSDENTLCTNGPIISSDLYGGEIYDAREKVTDSGNWEKCVTRDFATDILRAQVSEGIEIVETLSPENIYVSPKKETIIDFGQNIAGIVRVKTHLKAGEEIILDHFEVTDKAGNYFDSIIDGGDVGKGCEQRTKFISDGSEEVYEPHFTFQGFRYVKVTAPEGYEIKAEDFEALALSTKKNTLGEFECSDDRINRLYKNTIWSQRSNMISIPTDCPQREKAGWTGDIAMYAKTALQNEDANAFLENWLISVEADQSENGAVPIVVPYNHIYVGTAKMLGKLCMNKGVVGSAGWGDAAVLVPWAMYEVSGNTDILEKQYKCMTGWAEYIINASKKRGSFSSRKYEKYLWNTGFHFGDWLIPSLSKKGYDMKLIMKAVFGTKKLVAPIFGYNTISIMAETAKLLGKISDAKKYEELSKNMKNAIQHTMINSEGRVRREYMGIYVLLLAFDLVPENLVGKVGKHLVRMIDENDGCLDTGFLGTPYILDALCKSGHTDRAYKLLMHDKCPSWLYEVNKGATTIWESWFSYDKNDEPLSISFNHYAFGCVDDWMFRYIGGIFPTAPAYKTFDIMVPKKIMLTGINHAKRSYISENGLIECEWKIDKDKLSMNVKVPCNTTARIHLWDGNVKTVGSGEYRF
ncbi:alpha-L-rhamnosidase [Clostridium luticellarii]|uniref:alpha-L-rhamnosidase n=1 Tax=Clostridium luticellarii TaxID=1691940 RepID=A0A2T0BL87_9CLOT|nr:alpha-L-rhamnosidase [Clostridium luticellarii]PRR84660.1 Bacterial alpha-L-rhamnosidase [Clostridium luticellarii]